MGGTGVRKNEALALLWENIDFKRKILVIPSYKTKAKRARMIYFKDDPSLERLLREIPKRDDNFLFGPLDGGKQWSSWWVSRKISKLLTELEFPWASCHTFRHTYISHLVMSGVSFAYRKRNCRT
jgi:integrase